MAGFTSYNPIVISLFIAGTAVPAMFCRDPFFLLLSWLGAFIYCLLLQGEKTGKEISWHWIFPVGGLILNPLFNHNGVTVLFVLNDHPITLEAALYGLTAGIGIAAVLLWFRIFSLLMTTDKLLYVFGSISPKLALILSMTLRYIPLFRKQVETVKEAQRTMGFYGEDSLLDKLHSGMKVFSIMVTWALENGVITADSMDARGYGCEKRTQFSLFRWRKKDSAYLFFIIVLITLTMVSFGKQGIGWEFFPQMKAYVSSFWTYLGYGCYTLAALSPSLLEGKERMKWKSFVSKI